MMIIITQTYRVRAIFFLRLHGPSFFAHSVLCSALHSRSRFYSFFIIFFFWRRSRLVRICSIPMSSNVSQPRKTSPRLLIHSIHSNDFFFAFSLQDKNLFFFSFRRLDFRIILLADSRIRNDFVVSPVFAPFVYGFTFQTILIVSTRIAPYVRWVIRGNVNSAKQTNKIPHSSKL